MTRGRKLPIVFDDDGRYHVTCRLHKWSQSYLQWRNAELAWYGHMRLDHGAVAGSSFRFDVEVAS